jgi:hypothetical protein
MTGIEIALLIGGGVLFIVSFFLPSGKKSEVKATELAKVEIKALVDREIENVKLPVQDVIDETITYAMEKGERAMDRLTNEKMMAISEYSDTVLKEIHKNQQEVVFLYDMLNDKHTALLETVSQVNSAAQGAKKKVAKAVAPEPEEEAPVSSSTDPKAFSPFVPPRVRSNSKRIIKKKPASESVAEIQEEVIAGNVVAFIEPELQFEPEEYEDVANKNELILEMHKDGKTYVDIARTLGLGIGEVRLVVDLFEDS